MNKQPVDYKQYDSRWALTDYSTKGEKTNIKESGCGPTCAAMVIETITGKKFTPADACAWALKHGYKAYKQGTYYSYFVPQFKEFGIACEQLNWNSMYGISDGLIHDKAFKLLKEGYYLIACMGPGTWTKGGHFVLVWWEDGKVRINDPASTKAVRLNGDPDTFRSQVKYYWAIDARAHNNREEADEMLTQEQFDKMMDNWLKRREQEDASEWSEAERKWAEENGIIYGDDSGKKMYKAFATREHMIVFLYRLAEKLGIVM